MENYESKIEQNLSSLFGDKKVMEFLSEQGQKLGYPFFVYDNGECGKNFVADNQQNLACLKIYRSCFAGGDAGLYGELSESLQDKEKVWQEVRTLISSKKELSEKQECVLALCGSWKEMRLYLKYAKYFKMSAFKIIVERDSFQLLETCLFWGITDEQDIYLVRNGSKYLLSHYVKDYKLRLQAEIELVNRHDLELWGFYTKNGDFSSGAYTYMRKLAENDEEIALWLKGVYIY